MSRLKKIFSSLLAVILILQVFFIVTASAATWSDGTNTQTVTVVTQSNWSIPGSESITFKQTKGIRTANNYNIFTGRNKTKETKCYGKWAISVHATDGSHDFSKNLTGSSLKINLKRDKTYIITVTWDYKSDTIDSLSKGSFSTYPTWEVKSTHKVSSCY